MVHNLIHHALSEIDGNCKAHALIPAAVRKNRGVNSNQLTFSIDERSSRISRIDSRVGLNEIFVIFNAEIGSARRADNSHGDGLAHTKRVSNREGQVANLNLRGIPRGIAAR